MKKKKESKPKNVLISSTIISIIGIIAFIGVLMFTYKLISTSDNIDTFSILYLYLVGIALMFYAGLNILPDIISINIWNGMEAYKKIK